VENLKVSVGAALAIETAATKKTAEAADEQADA
jgi:hypothetical protein